MLVSHGPPPSPLQGSPGSRLLLAGTSGWGRGWAASYSVEHRWRYRKRSALFRRDGQVQASTNGKRQPLPKASLEPVLRQA